jgi:hypothetical protein
MWQSTGSLVRLYLAVQRERAHQVVMKLRTHAAQINAAGRTDHGPLSEYSETHNRAGDPYGAVCQECATWELGNR